jgi:hypothetical protein
MRRPIENHSAPGYVIYDPFLGSGTTIIAAELTGRVCHAIDIDPCCVAIAIARAHRPSGAFGLEGLKASTSRQKIPGSQPAA